MQPIQQHFFAGMKGLNTAQQLKIALADAAAEAKPILPQRTTRLLFGMQNTFLVYGKVCSLWMGGWRVRSTRMCLHHPYEGEGL